MMSLVSMLLSNLLLWLWLMAAFGVMASSRGSPRRRLWGLSLLAVFWLLASRPAAELLIDPLESRYDVPAVASLAGRGVRQVVVLTGGGYPPRGELLAWALPDASAHRFLSGLELCARLGPQCRIIFSGSAGRGNRSVATAEAMRDLAQRLDPGRQILAEATSGSTAEHPLHVRPLLEDGPFALLTSAYHMPRAMRSFRRAGLQPIAFPVDSSPGGTYGWSDWLPAFHNLRTIELAWREYLAIVLYTFRGW